MSATNGSSPKVELWWKDEKYEFKLTMREIEILEDAFDRGIDDIDLGRTKASMYLLVFATQRSETPLTIDELRDMDPDTFVEAAAPPDDDEEQDPTPAVEDGDESAPKTSGKKRSAKVSTSGS